MIESQHGGDSDIAIIGMAGRFPQADDVAQFWANLVAGRDCVTEFSAEELRSAGVLPADLERPGYVRANQVLRGIEQFDADLFGIARAEAEILDPQHRLLLECAYVALEDAGYDPLTHSELVGVYVGSGMNTYLLHNLQARYREASSVEHYQLMLASDKDFLATRISYKLNLKGPSLSINTACSTSLVAVHIACLSLLNGECQMALAGSVSIRVPQIAGYQHQDGMIFSPDGHCHAFAADAGGTILGNGLGVIVLKRLADAVADGDCIRAVIKGSAINNDGSLKAGYTAPSIEGQAAVIVEAMAIAGVEPRSIGYIEAHGTGTSLGDPVEVAALTLAHSRGGRGEERQYCALGSVKTNIGHLDTAAGMAGLIKTVLMLEHRTLVPSLHFSAPNPAIDFSNSPFFVQTRTMPWASTQGRPLRAGVSAFGIGGTNAHVILEEAAQRPRPAVATRQELVLLCAKSPDQLEETTQRLARHLRRQPELPLCDVAFTLAVGRQQHALRRMVVGASTHEVALSLALADGEKVLTHETSVTGRRPVFLLPARLDSPVEPSHVLCESEPEFRRHFEICMAGLDPAARDGNARSFAAEYAYIQLFMSAGVQPRAVAGWGVGALVAACVTGVVALNDALTLVALSSKAGRLDSGEVQRRLAGVTLQPPRMAVLCASSGARVTEVMAQDPAFWVDQWVLQHDAAAVARAVKEQDPTVLLDSSLGGGVWESPRSEATGAPGDSLDRFLQALGRLWLAGVDVDWQRYFAARPVRRMPLPTYSFWRQRYWIESEHADLRAPSDQRSALARELAAAGVPVRARILTAHLQRQIAQILGAPATELPDVSRSFMELKLESLMLIEIVTRLGGELALNIPASALVEFPTIASFSAHVSTLLAAPADVQAAAATGAAGTGEGRRAAIEQQRLRRATTRRSGSGT